MRIQQDTAVVFVGGKRRSFSRKAAYRNEACARIKAKYPCECDAPEPEVGYPGMSCDRHSWGPEKWCKLVSRLARFLRFLDKREREAAQEARASRKAIRRDATAADSRFLRGTM